MIFSFFTLQIVFLSLRYYILSTHSFNNKQITFIYRTYNVYTLTLINMICNCLLNCVLGPIGWLCITQLCQHNNKSYDVHRLIQLKLTAIQYYRNIRLINVYSDIFTCQILHRIGYSVKYYHIIANTLNIIVHYTACFQFGYLDSCNVYTEMVSPYFTYEKISFKDTHFQDRTSLFYREHSII